MTKNQELIAATRKWLAVEPRLYTYGMKLLTDLADALEETTKAEDDAWIDEIRDRIVRNEVPVALEGNTILALIVELHRRSQIIHDLQLDKGWRSQDTLPPDEVRDRLALVSHAVDRLTDRSHILEQANQLLRENRRLMRDALTEVREMCRRTTSAWMTVERIEQFVAGVLETTNDQTGSAASEAGQAVS